MIDEIVSLDVKSTKDFESLTQLYKRIFNFLLFKNKELIPPLQDEFTSSITSFNLEKEVAAALESVIPRAALGPFVSLTPAEKVTQLIELSNLVIGIRLFNKEIGKGGGSLASLSDLVTSSGTEISGLLSNEIELTGILCEEYSNFLQNIDKMRENYDSVDITKWKDELIFIRQYLAYLAIIQEELEISENTLEAGETKYNKEINELKQLLGNKSSAPKEQVYPKFAVLSQAYVQLLEEKTLSANRLELFEFLVQSKRGVKLTFPSLQIKNVPTSISSSLPHVPASSDVSQLLPQTTPDFMQTPLDFLGFCLYSLVKKGGLLIPGQPNLGVYRYKQKHCVFSDSQFVEEFIDNPEDYLKGVMKQCREKPELIHLLRMEDNFQNLQFNWREVKKASTKLLFDKEVETPLHFIEKNIDANYCWNEWELRKKAIQLADIRKKKTKATQTILSNFKVDSEIQTWLPKDKGTNTGVNKGVNPLRPRNYILGLRDKNVE